MNSASADEDEAPTTDKPKQTNFLSNFQVNLKRINATFGNYYLKNGIIKCCSALNSGQLSITSFFCRNSTCYHTNHSPVFFWAGNHLNSCPDSDLRKN